MGKIMLNGVDYSAATVSGVTGVKGNAETNYRTGSVNITPANIGLGNVNNTADANKNVKYATSAGTATKATQDGSGNIITSTYATKEELSNKSPFKGVFNNGNIDNLSTPGIYWLQINGNVTGTLPVGNDNYGFLEIVCHRESDPTYMQRFTLYQSGRVFTRTHVNGSWTSWVCVTDKYLPLTNIANNLTTTAAGYVMDARQGKILNDNMFRFKSNYICTFNSNGGSASYSPQGHKALLLRWNMTQTSTGAYNGYKTMIVPLDELDFMYAIDVGDTYYGLQLSSSKLTLSRIGNQNTTRLDSMFVSYLD